MILDKLQIVSFAVRDGAGVHRPHSAGELPWIRRERVSGGGGIIDWGRGEYGSLFDEKGSDTVARDNYREILLIFVTQRN